MQNFFNLRPNLALILLLLLCVSGLFSLTKIEYNNSPKTFFPRDSNTMRYETKVREIFPHEELIVALFEGDNLYSRDFLDKYQRLTDLLESHENVDRVINILNLDQIVGSEGGFDIYPLVDLEEYTSAEATKQKIKQDRFAKNFVVSEDLSSLLFIIRPLDVDDSFKNKSLVEYFQAKIKEVGLEKNNTALAGPIVVSNYELIESLRDNSVFVPITVFIGFLMIWLLFRRFIAIVVSTLCLTAILNNSLWLFVLFNQPFNTISGLLGPLLSALSIALLIHVFNGISLSSSRGFKGRERIDRTLSAIKKPAFFTVLTTAASLLSLFTSPILPVAYFGLTSAVGILFGFFVIIYLGIPVLAKYDNKPWPRPQFGLHHVENLMTKMALYSLRRSKFFLAFFAAGFFLSLPLISNIVVESNVLKFFSESHPITKSNDLIQKEIAGTWSFDLVLESNEKDYFKKPEILEDIRSYQSWAETLPKIDNSLSISEFVEEMHWAFHSEKEEYRKIPQNPNLISQYIFIYAGDDLYELVNRDFTITRIPMNTSEYHANAADKISQELMAKAKEIFPKDIDINMVGIAQIFAEQEDLLVIGQMRSLVVSVFLILVFLLILWRSFRDSIICLLPNIAPALVTFSTMGLFNIWFDFATALISSHIIGIAVDDTIHVYHGVKKRLDRGLSLSLSTFLTFRDTGRAVLFTTLILCAQFSILVFSNYIPSQKYGFLSCIGLFSALLFEIFLLPPLIAALYKRKSPTKLVAKA